MGQRWDTPRHTTEQGLCRQAELTDSKGVHYCLTPESKCLEIISSIYCHIVFGVIPLKQDSLTLLGTTCPEPGLQQNVTFLRRQNSAKEGVPMASSLHIFLVLSSQSPFKDAGTNAFLIY